MELIESIKRNLGPTTPRGEAMLAKARRRTSLMKKAGFQLHESQQTDVERVPSWSENWAAFTWSILSQRVRTQSHPKAVLIDSADTPLLHIVAESALAWFADRGGAVIVDVNLLVLLHPHWHHICGDENNATKITASAHRLAALMIANAIKKQCHLVIAMTANDIEGWRTLAGLLDQNQYQISGIFGAQRRDSSIARDVALQHELQAETNMTVVVLASDQTASADVKDIVSGKLSTDPNMTNSPAERGNREIRLGTFAKNNQAPTKASLKTPSQSPQSLPPSPPRIIQQKVARPVNTPTVMPANADESAIKSQAPSGSKQSSQNEPASEHDKVIERRKAMQANIRRKADG